MTSEAAAFTLTESDLKYNVLKDEVAQRDYTAELKTNSPDTSAFSDRTFLYDIEAVDDVIEPMAMAVGETFVRQQTTPADEETSSVNRYLNITELGHKLGKGSTNTGYEVLGVEGLPAEFEGYRLCVKAYHQFNIARRADGIVYQANQSDFMSGLAAAEQVVDNKLAAEQVLKEFLIANGLAPRQAGFVRQRAPIKKDVWKEHYFMVPVMEMVGDADFSLEELAKLSIADQEATLDELERVLTVSNDYANSKGYEIGDHSFRYSNLDGAPKIYIIDVGLVSADLGMGFDPTAEADRYRRKLGLISE